MLIEKLADQAIASGTYQELDRVYLINRIMNLVGEEQPVGKESDLFAALVELAVKNHKIPDDQTSRMILQDTLHNFCMPLPSKVNEIFWNKFQNSSQEATDWFYDLCVKNDYVKAAAIKRNIEFSGTSSGGHPLEITINLSKPEKDPKAIAQAAKAASTTYPKCALCLENEGFSGNYRQASRTNLRLIRLSVGGNNWGMQYSPYAYFAEHCIFLDQKHVPMQIGTQTLRNLAEITQMFPQYMVGTNADLPIVGGSLLSHEHYQGGRHVFPMMKAKIIRKLHFDAFPNVEAGIVDWPMTDIRLSGTDEEVIKLASRIIKSWKSYSDEKLQIVAEKDGVMHHTVTPIMHRENGKVILDIVLRDNNTSPKYPLGIFHPHENLWHIKKENIGLIEVMGRAILPGRLKKELDEVKKYWLGQDNQIAEKHLKWADAVASKQQITAENVEAVLQQELIEVFDQVLTDAGVFKQDSEGQAGLLRFIAEIA